MHVLWFTSGKLVHVPPLPLGWHTEYVFWRMGHIKYFLFIMELRRATTCSAVNALHLIASRKLTIQKISLIRKFWKFIPFDIAELWVKSNSNGLLQEEEKAPPLHLRDLCYGLVTVRPSPVIWSANSRGKYMPDDCRRRNYMYDPLVCNRMFQYSVDKNWYKS